MPELSSGHQRTVQHRPADIDSVVTCRWNGSSGDENHPLGGTFDPSDLLCHVCVVVCVRPRKDTLGYSRAGKHWTSFNQIWNRLKCFYYYFYKSFTTPSCHVCYSLALKRQFNTSIIHQKHTLFGFDSFSNKKETESTSETSTDYFQWNKYDL